jgi:nitrate/nitrite transporter NarK
MTEKGKQAGLGAGMFGGAGVIALVALGTFSTFVIAALSKAMDVWLAALIVTVIYAAVAGALALIGKQRAAQATPAVPEQTVDTLKEDAQWAKTRLQSESR